MGLAGTNCEKWRNHLRSCVALVGLFGCGCSLARQDLALRSGAHDFRFIETARGRHQGSSGNSAHPDNARVGQLSNEGRP